MQPIIKTKRTENEPFFDATESDVENEEENTDDGSPRQPPPRRRAPASTPDPSEARNKRRGKLFGETKLFDELVEGMKQQAADRAAEKDPDRCFCMGLVGHFKNRTPDAKLELQTEILQAIQRYNYKSRHNYYPGPSTSMTPTQPPQYHPGSAFNNTRYDMQRGRFNPINIQASNSNSPVFTEVQNAGRNNSPASETGPNSIPSTSFADESVRSPMSDQSSTGYLENYY